MALRLAAPCTTQLARPLRHAALPRCPPLPPAAIRRRQRHRCLPATCAAAPQREHHSTDGGSLSSGSGSSGDEDGSSSQGSGSAYSNGGSGGTVGSRGKGRLRPTLASVDEDAAEAVFLSSNEEAPASAEALDRDAFKEASRRHFRTVFDHERWAAHRSTRRYVRHAVGMLKSRMVRGLSAPLFYIAALSTAICAGHQASDWGLLPEWAFELSVRSVEPFALTSFALSLLLVFRTNASYSRWLDARKNWGTIVNRSRDLVRQGITYMPREDSALLRLLCRWTVAFSRSLMAHLRSDVDAETELRRVLPPVEAESVLAAEHRPAYCLQVLSEIIREAQLGAPPPALAGSSSTAFQAPAGWAPHGNGSGGDRRQVLAAERAAPAEPGGRAGPGQMPSGAGFRMDENLTALEDMVGGCERILRTPIPLSYTRHTSRFMMIFLSLLPLALWNSCRWATVPICVIISFLLLGIEEIGVQIEEPFSILPLEQLCDVVERNVWELHRMHTESLGREAGGGGQQALLSARGVVQAAKLAEE